MKTAREMHDEQEAQRQSARAEYYKAQARAQMQAGMVGAGSSAATAAGVFGSIVAALLAIFAIFG